MTMGRGSDTRMYNPRSESSHLYTGGDDRERDKYRYGDGDSEHMDDIKGKEQKENERVKVSSAPHLKIEAPKHAPPEMEEGGFEDEHTPPQMEEGENAVGAEVSQLTAPSGYVDSGLNASAGAMAGPGAALGGYRPMLATGEPMDMAFSSLMKGKGAAESKVWSQPKFRHRAPGGRRPWIGTSIRGKSASRRLAPRTEHGGLTEQKYAVEPSHGGRSVVQPLKLFPAEYRQRLAQSQRIKLQGGMSMPYSSHAPYGQRSMAGVGRLTGQLPGQAAAAKVPALSKPKSLPKVKNVFKSDIMKFNIDYLHYSQLRNLLRQVKHALADKEGARKALPTSGGGPGEVGQAGHRDGGTTRPEGGTENIDEDDNPINWAAYPSEVARGSGHV